MDDFVGFVVVLIIASTVGFVAMALFWIFVGAFICMALLGAIAKIVELLERRRSKKAIPQKQRDDDQECRDEDDIADHAASVGQKARFRRDRAVLGRSDAEGGQS